MNKLFALALVVVMLTPVAVSAQDLAKNRLAQGIEKYEELEWETAIRFLNEALQIGLSETDQVEAYKYLGFCYIDNSNQLTKAEEAFQNLLKVNPDYELSPNTSPKYLGTFNKVKAALPKTGNISVKSDPSGAQVSLDNVLQSNRTPMMIRDVMVGTHALKVTLNGYQDWTQQVNVEAGKTTELEAKLLRVPSTGPGTQPTGEVKRGSALPWIIIGGVAAVGGAVAAAVLLSGGDDEPDDEPNGNGNGNGEPQTTSLGIRVKFP